jgi:Fe2+ or Zn2+ uptake regulation protein
MPTSQGRTRQRNTWQRGAILDAMRTARCHVTAEEVHLRVRRGPRAIGLATVYRALDAFVREGLVEPAHVGDGRVRYGLAANHHDHVVCVSCGRWEPIERCLVSPPPRLASGFVVIGHQLELYGYCARCGRPEAHVPRAAARPARRKERS